MSEACVYTFPGDHPETVDAEEWRCPHDPYQESDCCIFHMPPGEKDERGITGSDIRHALEERIQERGRRPKQFIGARFARLDLGHSVFQAPDNFPIDFSHALIEDDLNLSHTDLMQPLLLEHATIQGDFRAEKTGFRRYLRLDGATIHGFTDVRDATFSETSQLREATFAGTSVNPEYPEFSATFRGATFDEKLILNGSTFKGRVDLRDTTIGAAVLHNVTLDVAVISRSTLDAIDITAPRALNGSAYISFYRSTVRQGVLSQPYTMQDGEPQYPDETTYYDLEQARIGDVTLRPGQDGDVFPYVRILDTRFDGFDFDSHEPHLRPDWTIHTYTGPKLPEGNIHGELQTVEETEPEAVERTYRTAKEAARAAGHPDGKSEFFRNQIRHRKRRHLATLRDREEAAKERVRAGVRLAGHQLNGLLTGHFERPWRVIGWSIILTVLCAGLYPLLGGIAVSGSDTVIQYGTADSLAEIGEQFQQSLYFSTVTFTTLGYGDMTPVGLYAKQLAGLEARLGSLLMALFIFVLGRRVS